MSLKDSIACNIEKFYEGDFSPGRSISECILKKTGSNINGIKQVWKLTVKEFSGSGTWTSPENIFGAFVVSHSVSPSFNLNQFAGEVVSLAGQSGFTFIDNITPNTSYSYTSSGTLTVVCLSC